MKYQSIKSKLGEVKYRSKIVNQQLGKEKIFAQELSSSEFKKLMRERLKQSKMDFDQVLKSHLTLSPFLEIGAENALRSAQLENSFKTQGFATDISLHSLAKAPEFAKNFKYRKFPNTICADANNLPFKSNSFPFVFLYETLHHFPDPKPVLLEIERVLAPGGVCMIGSEPITPKIQITIWRRPNVLRPWEKFLKVLLILPFISTIGKTETDYGILEESFSLSVWQNALSVFNKVKVHIFGYPFGPSQTLDKSRKPKWLNPNIIMKTALLLGGGLFAICYKGNDYQKPQKKQLSSAQSREFSKNLNSFLICPNCKINNKSEIGLLNKKTNFICPNCQQIYSKHKGVLVLLEDNLKNAILK